MSIRIVEDINLVDIVEDWSRVRSPSRAARRRRQGHRQNIRFLRVPKKAAFTIDGGRTFVVHPEIAKELRRQISQQLQADVASTILGGAFL
jgi:hypothetical protein